MSGERWGGRGSTKTHERKGQEMGPRGDRDGSNRGNGQGERCHKREDQLLKHIDQFRLNDLHASVKKCSRRDDNKKVDKLARETDTHRRQQRQYVTTASHENEWPRNALSIDAAPFTDITSKRHDTSHGDGDSSDKGNIRGQGAESQGTDGKTEKKRQWPPGHNQAARRNGEGKKKEKEGRRKEKDQGRRKKKMAKKAKRERKELSGRSAASGKRKQATRGRSSSKGTAGKGRWQCCIPIVMCTPLTTATPYLWCRLPSHACVANSC